MSPALEATATSGTEPTHRDPAGIDTDSVGQWLAAHLPGSAPPFAFELVAAGRSNLTYRVEDSSNHLYAVRRPPVHHVLPTAHDMAREHRILSALSATAVPVPHTLAFCADPAVTGAPFYVMTYVEGAVLRDRATAEATFDAGARHQIGPHVADTLAALHSVRIDEVGLGDLGRQEGYIERQLRRWTEQYRAASATRQGPIDEIGGALAARIPEQRDVTLVHGDFRLDNLVLDGYGRVAAVLDWELCTLGDPMADVGLLLVYWGEPGETLIPGVALPSSAAGFAGRDEVLARYALTSGRDVADVAYFMAFGYWKLACILHGVHARYVAGAGAGDRGAVDDLPRVIDRLAELAGDTLEAR